MEHPDLAQFAAVVAALGAVPLLAGRGRTVLLGGLVLLTVGEGLLALAISGTGKLDTVTSPAAGAAAVVGVCVLAAAGALAVRRPAWVPLAVLAAAPLRPPIAFESGGGFPITVAEDGQLGRLLPLYFVLAAGALALAWRILRSHPGAARALPRVIAFPAAAFVAFACLSLTWAERIAPAAELLAYFTIPFALLVAVVARAPFPDWAPRALARIGIALGVVFAAVGLYQAATRELFFFSPNLAVSNNNSDYFRVTSLFGDPSLYGRHVVLGMGLVLVVLALRRMDTRVGVGLLAVMWGGLLFSYSQSSMVALIAVTLAVAAATGGRRVRQVVAAGLAAVLLAGLGYVASIEIRGDSLRRETSDRTVRVEDTVRVVREEPLKGVGIGGQASASRRLAEEEREDRPTASFVSHTTPLTVAAELGAIGLALYLWLIVGGARAIAGVARLDRGLGIALGACLLALFVHALFYSGFLEDPLTWLVLAVAAGQLTWPRRDDGVHRQVAAEA